MWQMTIVYPKGDPLALERADAQDGRDVTMLHQEESSAGHYDYTAYAALEEVPGLAHLRVRKNITQDDDEDFNYSTTFYESPYSAYGVSESTKEQSQEWFEARHGCFLREANFDGAGDKTFIGTVPRRYSDQGERLVDERRLTSTQEDEFIGLALNKHRHPKKSHIKRCLWSNEQLSTKAEKKCSFDVRHSWSFFQRQGLELCYVEVEARQWKDQDHPDCAHDGSDLIAVDLTIVFDGGRTESVTLSICGGMKS